MKKQSSYAKLKARYEQQLQDMRKDIWTLIEGNFNDKVAVEVRYRHIRDYQALLMRSNARALGVKMHSGIMEMIKGTGKSGKSV